MKIGNGRLPLSLGDHKFIVYGGPYRQKPAEFIGVRMAAEIDMPAEIVVPTEDFQVPPLEEVRDGLDEAVSRILLGQPLYVGCMGGIGRTGLFMALLAKAFGEQDPVTYVRAHYLAHAVETMGQRKYIADFTIPAWTRKKIAIARFFFRFRTKNLLTRLPAYVR